MDNGYGTADGQSRPYICFATNIILYSQKHSNIKGEWIGRTVLLVFFWTKGVTLGQGWINQRENIEWVYQKKDGLSQFDGVRFVTTKNYKKKNNLELQKISNISFTWPLLILESALIGEKIWTEWKGCYVSSFKKCRLPDPLSKK